MYLKDAEATEALGRRLGELAAPGLIVALEGDLGAGKSCLARGMARGLGIGGRIPSPTFIIVAEYLAGRLPFHHLDLYRIVDSSELDQLGLDEILGGDGVCAVEWPSRAPELLQGALWIRLEEQGEGRVAHFDGPPELVGLLHG